MKIVYNVKIIEIKKNILNGSKNPIVGTDGH